MNGGGLEHRAAKVSFVNGLSTILTLAFQLVSVPVCLKYWGKTSYGSWLALSSAFMMLRSMDGGFALYVGNKLNYLYHENTDALRAHLSSAIAGIVLIGTLQLASAAGVIALHPLASALGVPTGEGDGRAGQAGLLVLIVSWVLTGSYISIVHRLLIPAGMMYQAAWWAMALQVTQFGAIMLAARLRFDLLTTSFLFSLVQIGIYLASAAYIRRVLPGFYPWLRGVDRRLGLRDLAHSCWLTGSNFIQQSTMSGSVLLISAFAGPAAVPLFTTVRTLTNLWTSVTSVLTAPLLPEVVRLHVRGEVQKLAAINGAYWLLVGCTVNLGALLTYPLIPFVYSRWTANAVILDDRLLCLMLGSVVVANAGALMALHLNGMNRLRIVFATSVARAILGLGGGAAGYRVMGISSFGFGILCGELVATMMNARYFVRQELTKKGSRLPANSFGPVILGTGSALLFFIAAGLGWAPGPWCWMVSVAGVAAASAWGWVALEPGVRLRLKNLIAGSSRPS